MPRRVSSPVFVGRAAELARLVAARDEAAAGRPSLALVAGEAGVGKSRLIGELATQSAAAGFAVLVGACLDLGGGGLPFAPFAEALRTWAHGLDDASQTAVVGTAAAALGSLVPALAPALPSIHEEVDPASRQARLFDAVLEVLGRIALDRPTLLVLEDLHWADGSTRDLVRFLVRNLRHERLLIVGTYRSDDLHRRHPLVPLLSELERSDRVERLELQRFDRDDLRAQLVGITGVAVTERDIDALLERSDGNPFYVEELVSGGHAADSAMPQSLREILGLRLGSLAGDATAIVRAASVVGIRVPGDRLFALTDFDEGQLADSLRAAVDAGILVPDTRSAGPAFAFRHALLQEAAYDDLLPTEQVRLHGRLANYLADLLANGSGDPAVVADFAVHAYHAGDQRGALLGSLRAMRVMDLAGAFQEALGHAERALELWPRVADAGSLTDFDHVDLLAAAARLAGNIWRPSRAVELGREALGELGPSAPAEQVAGLLGDLWMSAHEASDREVMDATAEQMAAVLDRLPDSRLKAHLLNLYAYGQGFRSRNHVAVAAHEQALALARSLRDDRMVAMIAPILARQLTILNRAGASASLLAAGEPTADFYDSTVMPFWTTVERHMALCWLGRYDEAVGVFERAAPMPLRYGLERRVAHWLLPYDALFELGRLDEAMEQEARAAIAVGNHISVGQGKIATMVKIIRGQLDLARSSIAGRLDHSPDMRLATLRLITSLARAERDLGAVRAAIDEALELAAGGEVDGLLWLLLPEAVGAAADAAVVARRRRRAADLEVAQADGRHWIARLRALADAAGAFGGAGAYCEAALATAEAEGARLEGTPDLRAWALAVERWADIRHAYGTAYSRLRLAEATLESGGDREVAEAALREARAGAEKLAAAPLLEVVATVASHARIDLGAAPPLDADSVDAPPAALSVLTGRERDVLGLVAGGHTNREIGDRLFISEKTVSVHVSNAMAKLGALSRYEAAASAERLGLLV